MAISLKEKKKPCVYVWKWTSKNIFASWFSSFPLYFLSFFPSSFFFKLKKMFLRIFQFKKTIGITNQFTSVLI